MAIYDFVTIGQTVTGMQLLPAGNVGLYNFTLAPLTAQMFSVLHVAQTEDFSIRAWFSTVPGGINVGGNRFIALDRMPIVYVVYDKNLSIQEAPNMVFLPLDAGDYILNFLNMTNTENIFSLKTGPFVGT